ncbi:hypothetical protein [Lacihabitans soyangensis]|uniref:Uncharacterized protein n=1 Tax=Lacihabitans soyangensis TaxID=869394 RepID=A0AAE3H8H4_9BACT|nr:hypothetical protein [Lacihabitans soyangensis]MCP9765150.1 hypothetical protein [Lacihabitans soyangensis]
MTADEFEAGVNNIIDNTPRRGVAGSEGITKSILKLIVGEFKKLYSSFVGITGSAVLNAPNGRNYVLTTLYCHRTLGSDNLTDEQYLAGSLNNQNWFQSVEKCWDYVNKLNIQNVRIYLLGTTANDPWVIDTSLIMFHKGEFYFGGSTNSAIGTAFISFTANGRLSFINTAANIYRCNIVQNGQQSIYLTSQSSLACGQLEVTLAAAALRFIGMSGAAFVNFQGGLTVNFGSNNQQVFHNNGNGAASVWIGNHTESVVLNTGAYTGIKWSTTGGGYNFYTHIINTVSFGLNSYPTVDFSGSVMIVGTGMALKTQHVPGNFDYALVLGTASPLRFADLNNASAKASVGADRSLMINSVGKVVVGQAENQLSSFNIQVRNTASVTVEEDANDPRPMMVELTFAGAKTVNLTNYPQNRQIIIVNTTTTGATINPVNGTSINLSALEAISIVKSTTGRNIAKAYGYVV